jgi:Beta-lactamase class C and other penicillin binding proteins
MKRLIFLLLIPLTLMVSCKNNPEKEQVAKLDQLCSSLFPDSEPGAAVLVMKGDDIIFDKGYGIADIETKKAIDGNTFFNIASVSKQFTAVAVLQLAEEGKLSLEDPVSKYFPEFKAPFWNDIRIKHLLSHSSGVPDARGGIPRELKIKGDEKLAMSYLPDLDFLHFQPGEAYEYMNPTFVMCGAIVEKVSGQPFTEYVAEHIFKPAGMDRTLYFDPEHQELIPDMAHGYEYEDVEDMPEERTAGSAASDEPKNWYEYDYGEETFFATRPDGGIYTSTHQFVQWEKALRANKVLSEASRVDAQSPHTFASDSPWSDYQNRPNTWYGYGWFIEPKTDSTKEVIYHTGDNGGFKILAARYPEDNALVLIFANRADWDRYEVMQQFEAILGL